MAKQTKSSGDDALAFTAGLVFGGLVGATAAVILAPTDGQTVRRRLSESINSLFGGGPKPATPVVEITSASEQPPAAVAAPPASAAP